VSLANALQQLASIEFNKQGFDGKQVNLLVDSYLCGRLDFKIRHFKSAPGIFRSFNSILTLFSTIEVKILNIIKKILRKQNINNIKPHFQNIEHIQYYIFRTITDIQ